jgi:hypothetical protein
MLRRSSTNRSVDNSATTLRSMEGWKLKSNSAKVLMLGTQQAL